ncbi:MAG TPA: SDR family oxidoreductase [Balneolales bacterium]|nr:SDR family oxidoreductase [Balneolales bacterium]
MDNQLDGKKILIIGGGTGIGLSVAKKSFDLGAKVMIASRSILKKEKQMRKIFGDETRLFTLDIISESDSVDLLNKLETFDHLIFAVRPDAKTGLFMETDINSVREAFESKLWGAYQFIQKAKEQIREGGSIILTSGIAGEKNIKGTSAMSMINSATETLCRSLSVELAPVRVNVVSPGFVEPKNEDVEKFAADHFPLRRLAKKDEITDAYIFLMTNTYTTGTILVVDGGARII